MELNKTFKDGLWSKEINVRDFVSNNITPYEGDASFLQGPTAVSYTHLILRSPPMLTFAPKASFNSSK